MRHARPEDLDRLEPLLVKLRRVDGLKEKSRGIFYRGGRAFLHFHEHEGGFFADARFGDDFERSCVSSAAEKKSFLSKLAAALNAGK
jgi:hypothetical protein